MCGWQRRCRPCMPSWFALTNEGRSGVTSWNTGSARDRKSPSRSQWRYSYKTRNSCQCRKLHRCPQIAEPEPTNDIPCVVLVVTVQHRFSWCDVHTFGCGHTNSSILEVRNAKSSICSWNREEHSSNSLEARLGLTFSLPHPCHFSPG